MSAIKVVVPIAAVVIIVWLVAQFATPQTGPCPGRDYTCERARAQAWFHQQGLTGQANADVVPLYIDGKIVGITGGFSDLNAGDRYVVEIYTSITAPTADPLGNCWDITSTDRTAGGQSHYIECFGARNFTGRGQVTLRKFLP